MISIHIGTGGMRIFQNSSIAVQKMAPFLRLSKIYQKNQLFLKDSSNNTVLFPLVAAILLTLAEGFVTTDFVRFHFFVPFFGIRACERSNATVQVANSH